MFEENVENRFIGAWISILSLVALLLLLTPVYFDKVASERKLAQSVQTELKEHYGDQINIWIDKDNRLCFNFTEGRPFVYVFEVKEFYKLHEP